MLVLFTFLTYQVVKCAEEHLTLATQARSYLRSQVELAKRDIKAAFTSPPPLDACFQACSKEITMHYSFDFAQQVRHT